VIKKRVSLLATFLVICLIFPALTSGGEITFVTSQGVGWSDDFDDGNIDGWTVQGFNMSTEPFSSLPGNITADDHTLCAYDEEWSQAYHPSNVVYGSWSFDLHCVNTPSNHSYIAFISGTPMVAGDTTSVPYEYGIMPVTGEFYDWNHSFVFYRRNPGQMNLIPLRTYDVDVVSGWYHINITRNLEGSFVVSFNGTTRFTVNHAGYTTSAFFSFYTEAGNALDNIVVIPHVNTTTPTTPIISTNGEPIIMTLLLIVGGGIAAVVVIAIIIRSRS
jgi:hypothetical protein